MATLYITRGLPGAGKTYWARQMVADADPPGSLVRLNRDDLRRMALDVTYRSPLRGPETAITAMRDVSLEALLRLGRDVICDDTNLRASYVRDLMRIAARAGASVKVVDFTDVPLGTCIDRDAQRPFNGPEHVGSEVIRGMHDLYLAQHHGKPLPIPDLPADYGDPYADAVPYVVPASPEAVVILVDLDGTLALMNGRSPYDESTVIDDLPNTPVIETVRALIVAGLEPVFMSGRTEACRADTERWLSRHVFHSSVMTSREVDTRQFASELRMRSVGDTRPDHVVKLELFNTHVRDRYDVRLVLDDRNQVVKLWRRLGLCCLQVAEGDF